MTLLALLASVTAFAAPPVAPGASTTGAPALPAAIPGRPSAPPALHRAKPPETFHCERKFVYQGKTLECDSNLARDGENLRPIFEDSPAALAELDAYQRGRRSVNSLAYVSTIGLAVTGLSYLAFRGSDRANIWRLTSYAGALTTVGSVLYGFAFLNANERRLGNAVRLHNDAHPDRQIELQFTTGFQF